MQISNLSRSSIFAARLRVMASSLLLVTLCMLALPADAQWQWRDKDGRMNISDRPPPRDVPDKDILRRPASAAVRQGPVAVAPGAGNEAGAASAPTANAAGGPSTSASAPKSSLEREVEARKKAEAQAQAAKLKADDERVAAQRASNCKNARGHAANLESGMRIARTNDAGERVVLDDQARAAELRRAREIIASDCQ